MLSPTDKHTHFWDQAVIGDTVVHCKEYRAGKSTFGVNTTVESVRLGMYSTSELPIGTLLAWISLASLL